MPEGILAVRYNLKALSEQGFHHVALNKAAGIGYPSFEYQLSHNATTLWETWYRSEDIFSRNHPMLGGVAEWLPTSVAGVSLAPTTVGGQELLFWPRIPSSATNVQYASATQGTKRGDASIAWEFLDLPKNRSSYDSAVVKVHLRILVPPGSTARLLLPNVREGDTVIKFAKELPDLEIAKSAAAATCNASRRRGLGFSYNWEFDSTKAVWHKVNRKKAIGTPCGSFLFHFSLAGTKWSPAESISLEEGKGTELSMYPGFYDVIIDNWRLTKDADTANASVAYCSDPETFSWDIDDATHII